MASSRTSNEQQRLVDDDAVADEHRDIVARKQPDVSAGHRVSPGPFQTFSSPQTSSHSRGFPLQQSVSWLITFALCIVIIWTVRAYELHGNITAVQKQTFNMIVTGLILVLGINFFEVFKTFAKASRSWLLSGPAQHFSDQEKDLIEEIESLTKVWALAWASRTKFVIVVSCAAWMFLNILAQTAVAIVSLTFSINDGTNYNGTYIRPGAANVSNLTCYYDYFNHKPCGGPVTSQALAHAYGDISSVSECGNYSDVLDVVKSKKNYGYYCNQTRHHQQYAYRFNEYNPNDTQKAYPRFTNRTITASSGPCIQYSMVGSFEIHPGGNFFYKYKNDTYEGNITIPGQSTATDGTTWIYRGANTPQEAVEYACGPRCIKMWAHRAWGQGENSTFFECPVTVDQVSNAVHPEHNVSDGMARLAAASIALQGRPDEGKDGKDIWPQYQLYAYGSAYETHFRQADQVGSDVAAFAIGSLSTMATTNFQIQVPGLVPYLGSSVAVHWDYILPLLAGIATVHAALSGFGVYLKAKFEEKKL
ncbi:hypothetical protein MMC08_002159 [Hypocenomyce scalaris]|nr:hypothetical protein [Hypocenomyce scalaris]